MRLFASPDLRVDHKDRALWLTPPFDLPFGGGSQTNSRNQRMKRWFPGLIRSVRRPQRKPFSR